MLTLYSNLTSEDWCSYPVDIRWDKMCLNKYRAFYDDEATKSDAEEESTNETSMMEVDGDNNDEIKETRAQLQKHRQIVNQ